MPIQFGSQSANQFRFDLTNKSGANIILGAGLVALTIVGAVVGLAWEFLCRVVPIVLVCAVVLAAVVGGLWLIGRVARALRG